MNNAKAMILKNKVEDMELKVGTEELLSKILEKIASIGVKKEDMEEDEGEEEGSYETVSEEDISDDE